MTLQEALLSIAVSVAAGGLIGAEREQAHGGRHGVDFGGVRTFPLVALAGALAAMLRPFAGAWLLAAVLVAIAALLAISHARSKGEDVGVSSEVAALVTFALGAIAGTPELLADGPRFLLVAAGAASTMGLLALKRPLHGFIARVSSDDVYATAKFVLLALVVIPLLPNTTIGPLNVLNPFKIGLMIALVAGISFAGYVAARLVGSRRGLLVTGIIGGLVSSTAVTLTLAGRAKEAPELVPTLRVAILAASSTMFVRVLAVTAIVEPALLAALAVPLGLMAICGYVLAFVLFRQEANKGSSSAPIPFRNPFELKQALAFGLLYGFVLFVSKAAEIHVGASGLYGSAILAGLTDVDAITLSLAELHRSGTATSVAAVGITLAAITNTLVKAGLATVAGGARFGQGLAPYLVLVLAGGGIALTLARIFS